MYSSTSQPARRSEKLESNDSSSAVALTGSNVLVGILVTADCTWVAEWVHRLLRVRQPYCRVMLLLRADLANIRRRTIGPMEPLMLCRARPVVKADRVDYDATPRTCRPSGPQPSFRILPEAASTRLTRTPRLATMVQVTSLRIGADTSTLSRVQIVPSTILKCQKMACIRERVLGWGRVCAYPFIQNPWRNIRTAETRISSCIIMSHHVATCGPSHPSRVPTCGLFC